MPFTADYDGVQVDSARVDPDTWKTWKANKDKLSFPCCKERAIPKRSKLFKQFFAHHPQSVCANRYETEEHRRIKFAVVNIAERLGHRAETEHRFNGGEVRADAIVHLPNPLVFEVQQSSQTMEITRARNREYRRQGVEVIWLMKKWPTDYKCNGSTEHVVRYRVEGEELFVVTPSKQVFRLEDFVEGVLRRGIRLNPNMLVQISAEDQVASMTEVCLHCGARVVYAHLIRKLKPESVCGQRLEGNFQVEWQTFATIDAAGMRRKLRSQKWHQGATVAKQGKSHRELYCPCGARLALTGNGPHVPEYSEFKALISVQHWCIHDDDGCHAATATPGVTLLGLSEVQRRIDYDLDKQRIKNEKWARTKAFLEYRSECLSDGESDYEFQDRMKDARAPEMSIAGFHRP